MQEKIAKNQKMNPTFSWPVQAKRGRWAAGLGTKKTILCFPPFFAVEQVEESMRRPFSAGWLLFVARTGGGVGRVINWYRRSSGGKLLLTIMDVVVRQVGGWKTVGQRDGHVMILPLCYCLRVVRVPVVESLAHLVFSFASWLVGCCYFLRFSIEHKR